MSKADFRKNQSPMEITTTSSKFGEQVAMDIVGPLPETQNGNRFIFKLQDDLTKLIDAYAKQLPFISLNFAYGMVSHNAF